MIELNVSGIASTKRGENKRLVVVTFGLFIFLSTFISIFGLTTLHITKLGVREVNPVINSSESKVTAKQTPKIIASQEDSFKDVLM